MSITVTVGHEVDNTIIYLDQNGNPMQTTPKPDSPPVWTDTPSAPGVDSFTASADGMQSVVKALAAGSDTLTLSVVVGGATFTATQLITISPAPQVLTSVAINSVIV